MDSCFGAIISFLIFLIALVVIIKTGLFGYMTGSLTLFNSLLEEVFKSLISILRGGVYIPDSGYF